MKSLLKPFALLLSVWAFAFAFQACSDDDENIPTEKDEEISSGKGEGFDNPKTEEFDGGNVTYQYNDGVMVLDDESVQSYLVKVESDTILYFSQSVPDELKPHTGGILTSGIMNEKLPYGLGNKIIAVTEEGDLYKCVTTTASLDEIFEVLSLSADIQLITDTISYPIEDVDGNIYEVSVSDRSNTRATVGSRKILTTTFKKETGSGLYSATGTLSLGAVATIKLELGKTADCSLALYAEVNGELGAQGEGKSYQKLFPKTGKWHILDARVPIPPHIVLRPFIDAELGLQGEFEGEARIGFSKQFEWEAGIKNNEKFIENRTNSTSTNNIIKSFSVDASGRIGLVLSIDFGIGLYTKKIAGGINNSIIAGFNTDFHLDNENLFKNRPNLNFEITSDIGGFLRANILGIELLDKSFDWKSYEIFSHSWPLLPTIEQNSLKIVKRTGSEPLVYNAEYELTGGLLNINGIASDALSMKPAFRIYNGEEEVYSLTDDTQSISGTGKQKFSFELTDLDENITYTGTPSLIIGNNMYDEKGITFPSICDNEEHPHAIDLGLPSGTLWCCMNVGALCPTDFGEYYPMSPGKDVATEEMGSGYSTPTKKEFEELINYTKQSLTTINGVEGLIFEASNGKSIFLPAAAHLWWNASDEIWEINNEGSGAYWTTTLHDEDYYDFLEFSKAIEEEEDNKPWFGDRDIDTNKLTIRPVYKGGVLK